MTDKKNQIGVTFGILFGLIHALWITTVAAGFGQNLINAVESGHFVSSTYSVTGFDPLTALIGVIGAGITGYVTGWISVYIYNLTGRKLD